MTWHPKIAMTKTIRIIISNEDDQIPCIQNEDDYDTIVSLGDDLGVNLVPHAYRCRV